MIDLIGDGEWRSRLAIGLRRSYGDSCLNSDGAMIDMSGLDRFISFDAASGVLRAEAGASLSQILAFAVPRGLFLPTTPGTRFVTLGGAVANDVHGKNHHLAESFGCHVKSFGLLRSDGQRCVVTPASDPGLFAATIGGLGLTGVIEWVELRLAKISSSYLDVETIPYGDLDGFWALSEESVKKFEHRVAWVDCTSRGANFGRGIFSRANWCTDSVYDTQDDRTWKGIPIDAPAFLLNRFTVATFNELYHRSQSAKAGRAGNITRRSFILSTPFLTGTASTERMACFNINASFPPAPTRDGVASLLDEITRSGQASFLVVLEDLRRARFARSPLLPARGRDSRPRFPQSRS